VVTYSRYDSLHHNIHHFTQRGQWMEMDLDLLRGGKYLENHFVSNGFRIKESNKKD